jgi:hypothetical protein
MVWPTRKNKYSPHVVKLQARQHMVRLFYARRMLNE